jgi:hypothetical protein
MFRGVEAVQSSQQVAGDLEQYRRLIALQKQMIKLARENEKAKRECAVLREKVAREVAARLARRKLSRRLKQKVKKILKQFPKMMMPQVGSATMKEPSPC